MKYLLLLLLLASNLFAEIPAKRWVGDWVYEKERITLNEDSSCTLVLDGEKTIKGRYGIDSIEGSLVVIGDNGKAHIFVAIIFDDSHDFSMDKPANGLNFYGYKFNHEYEAKYEKKNRPSKTFRRRVK